MKLPGMKFSDGITKGKQVKFGGLNMSKGATDGELCDMRNLTGDHYPLLATRPRRRHLFTLNVPSEGSVFSWNGLCWIDGGVVYYEGTAVGVVSPGAKRFAALGAYIVIFPDKAYYNTETGGFGFLESSATLKEATFCDGTLYGEEAAANCIYVENIEWQGQTEASIRFNPGDAVTISGCTVNEGNNQTLVIREIDGDRLYFYENSFQLNEDGSAYTESNITIARTVPDLLYLCENENRLWGCTETTIYASKLGDIFNWNVYDGLETDSWAVDTGSAGDFTGCISYRGFPVFFKEDYVYKVYGSTPSEFEILGSATLGVKEGCSGSLAVAGEVLFYLSKSGVVAYTGGIPQPVGDAFETMRYRNAVAGSDGLKYYISMMDELSAWSMYVYDTQKGLWHREDETHALQFTKWEGNLCFVNDNGEIWLVRNPGSGTEAPEYAQWDLEPAVEWSAEFADFTDADPNYKGISKIQIRLELVEEDAMVQVWMMFDSDGEWRQVNGALNEGSKRSYYLPIIPRRADHYRLKLTGSGNCRIHSLVREYYSGSALRPKSGRS